MIIIFLINFMCLLGLYVIAIMKIGDLEKKQKQFEQMNENLQHSLLTKICTNSVVKEQYNLELLKYLFEKLQIEEPKSDYKFTR
ncbi:MAG: hypothetical protein PHT76_14895 [Anaerostipes sp.]|nr:hypothetical protein [Anaerostipes sp.]